MFLFIVNKLFNILVQVYEMFYEEAKTEEVQWRPYEGLF